MTEIYDGSRPAKGGMFKLDPAAPLWRTEEEKEQDRFYPNLEFPNNLLGTVYQNLLEEKLKLEPDDKDRIVMQHQFEYILNGRKERIVSSIIVFIHKRCMVMMRAAPRSTPHVLQA